MAINVEPTSPSVHVGTTSFPTPQLIVFPDVGTIPVHVGTTSFPGTIPVQVANAFDPVIALAARQVNYRPIPKIYGSHLVLGLTYGTSASGIQINTAASANAISERYPIMPPTLVP